MNNIYITGELNLDNYKEVLEKIIFAKENKTHTTIYLNSTGGCINYALSIYDLINGYQNFSSIATGIVASSAIIILLSAPIDKRYATKNTEFLIHEASYENLNLGASLLKKYSKNLMKLNNIINKIILRETKLNKNQIKKFTKETYIFYAKEALKYGFINEIL